MSWHDWPDESAVGTNEGEHPSYHLTQQSHGPATPLTDLHEELRLLFRSIPCIVTHDLDDAGVVRIDSEVLPDPLLMPIMRFETTRPEIKYRRVGRRSDMPVRHMGTTSLSEAVHPLYGNSYRVDLLPSGISNEILSDRRRLLDVQLRGPQSR